jgi:phospholipid/cholesterol/gamma-HCH transport system substrate-binding protein
MNRRALTVRGMVVRSLIAALAVGALASCGSSGMTVTAQFKDAAGLFVGNDVGILGVPVGEVESVTPRGNTVDVVLHINDGVRVPASAGAVIVSRSVATDRYVELTPVYRSGPAMADGATIDVERTRTPVEFDELMGSLRTISKDLAGEKGSQPLKRALQGTARALDGNGVRISGALDDLATTLESANSSSDDFVATVKNLDRFTRVMAANDRLASAFAADVADATDLLADERGSLEATFKALTRMLREMTAFVHKHRDEIGSQMDDLAVVANALVSKQDNLAELLETMPLMLQNGPQTIDDKLHMNFLTRPGDLLPAEAGFAQLCARAPAGFCDPFSLAAKSLFDVIRLIAGVS